MKFPEPLLKVRMFGYRMTSDVVSSHPKNCCCRNGAIICNHKWRFLLLRSRTQNASFLLVIAKGDEVPLKHAILLKQDFPLCFGTGPRLNWGALLQALQQFQVMLLAWWMYCEQLERHSRASLKLHCDCLAVCSSSVIMMNLAVSLLDSFEQIGTFPGKLLSYFVHAFCQPFPL